MIFSLSILYSLLFGFSRASVKFMLVIRATARRVCASNQKTCMRYNNFMIWPLYKNYIPHNQFLMLLIGPILSLEKQEPVLSSTYLSLLWALWCLHSNHTYKGSCEQCTEPPAEGRSMSTQSELLPRCPADEYPGKGWGLTWHWTEKERPIRFWRRSLWCFWPRGWWS